MTNALENRRANGWHDDEPDWLCQHGVNVSVEGDCDACYRSLEELLEPPLRPVVRRKRARSDLRGGAALEGAPHE